MEAVEPREERFAAAIAALSGAANLRAAGGARGKEDGASALEERRAEIVDKVQGS